MSFKERALREVRAVVSTALFFGAWIGGLILLKQLLLEEYSIEFHDYSTVLIGALVLSKVVLILEHVPLPWTQTQPAWVDVVVRTALYTAGAFAVMLLEKSFEARHEYGSIGAAARAVIAAENTHHLLTNTVCIAAAFATYNAIAVVRRHLGEGGLRRLFSQPVSPRESGG